MSFPGNQRTAEEGKPDGQKTPFSGLIERKRRGAKVGTFFYTAMPCNSVIMTGMSGAITAQEMGRRGGLARARNLSKKRQSEIGKKAAKAAAKVKSRRTCEYCGVAFLGWRRSKFCSPEHRRAHYAES